MKLLNSYKLCILDRVRHAAYNINNSNQQLQKQICDLHNSYYIHIVMQTDHR